MDVRKLAIVLCALTLFAVGIVLYFQHEEGGDERRPPNDVALAAQIEARHGPVLRALGIRSLGVDRRTDDVVVVFANGGRVGRKLAGRLPGLAGKEGCGELEVGVAIGDSLTAWGDAKSPDFEARLDCVVDEVARQAADLR